MDKRLWFFITMFSTSESSGGFGGKAGWFWENVGLMMGAKRDWIWASNGT